MEERVVLISQINKQQLLALFNSFGINTLMLLDMEISQKICKIVPYTSAECNDQFYTSDDERSVSDNKEHTRKRNTKTQSLFFNLTHRDPSLWNKIHVNKMIYHKPLGIMFIFCNNKKSQDIMKFLKKIYKVVPYSSVPLSAETIPEESP